MDAPPCDKVLIIDDDVPSLELLKSILERYESNSVRCIANPLEAVDAYLAFEPDLVLLDLTMPHLDGFTVLERLRKVTAPDDFRPIIVLTGDQSEQAKERALSSGANDFLAKPYLPKEILLRTRNLLQTRHLHLQLKENNQSLEETVAERTRDLVKAMKELHAAQQHMLQQERLRALGTMASGVVHDFNNALAIILSLGEFVILDCQKQGLNGNVIPRMKSILTAAEDAARMANRLTQFYRKAPAETEVSLDLNEIIRQAVDLTEPRWKTQAMERGIRIEVCLNLGESLPSIVGHRSELREVLTNLIFNAVDAMPEGGSLTFTSRVRHQEIELTLRDTGMGMKEEVRLRCLEPFFTTKGDRGSGLGLAMVAGIVQQHGGSMNIKSSPGAGTTFILQFPRERRLHAGFSEVVDTRMDRPLHVLVVDDQDLFRDIIVQILENDGHAVSAAANATDAIKLLEGGPFDLLITDHGMPGMNGEQLVSYAKTQHPNMRCLLLTSYGRLESEVGASSPDLIIAKPVTMAKLRRAIVGVMERDASIGKPPGAVQGKGRAEAYPSPVFPEDGISPRKASRRAGARTDG